MASLGHHSVGQLKKCYFPNEYYLIGIFEQVSTQHLFVTVKL